MKVISLILVLILIYSSSSFGALNAMCLNKKGKSTGCFVDNREGNLIIEYKDKENFDLNKTIPGKKITGLTFGEYAKRRVGAAVATGVIVNPLFLFLLFSKKKIDNYGVQFINNNGNADSALIQIKKKYSEGLKVMLQSISGKEVVYPEPATKKK